MVVWGWVMSRVIVRVRVPVGVRVKEKFAFNIITVRGRSRVVSGLGLMIRPVLELWCGAKRLVAPPPLSIRVVVWG